MTSDTRKTKAELLKEIGRLRKMVESDTNRRFFESAPLPYQSLDAEGCVLDVNKAWLELLGYRREQILGRWFGEFLTPESQEIFRQRFCVFLAEGEVNHADFTALRQDGVQVHVSAEGRIVYDADGNFRQTQCILYDISEQRRVVEVLASSEQRFRGLFESSLDGIVYTNDFGSILNANRAFCSMIGFSVDELLGRHIRDITPDEYHEVEWNIVRMEVGDKGYSREYGKEFFHAKGHRIPVTVRVWLNRDERGNTAGMWCMARDLSREKTAELLAAKSNARYQLLAENTEDVIWSLDNDFRYTYISPSVTRLRGYRPEELVGTSICDSIMKESQGILATSNVVAFEADAQTNPEKALRIELELLCKDGGTVWVESLVKMMFDDAGNRSGFVGSTRDITDRKRTEEELANSERNYRNIFEHSVEGLYQSTPDGRFVSVNPTLALLLDYESPQAVIDSIHEIATEFYYSQGDRKAMVTALERDDEVRDFEVRIRRRDGSIIWVTENARLIRDEDGVPVMYEGSIVDISKRKRTEAALLRSEKLLNEVQRLSLTGGWESNIATGEVYWTESQYRIFGLTPGEPIRGHLNFMEKNVIQDDHREFLRAWNRALESRQRGQIEFRAHRADGSLGVYQSVIIPDVDKSGEVVRIYGSTRDVTLEKEAEQELVSSHERLLNILDGMDADIYVSSLDGHDILFINKYMRENFGTPAPGVKCHEIFRGEKNRCSHCPKPELIDSEGNPMPTIIRERPNPLTGKWYLNHDRAIRWLEGKLVHMHMAADITELKELEQELVSAMARAEAASLAKNEFLANMSHEIRTPLNGLLGMMQLLQLSSLVEEQREYVDIALDSGRNLLQILNDILDLSKVESGKLELEEEEIELGEVLDSVVSVFRHSAESRGLRMTWSVDEKLPVYFLSDKGRLRQILFNLIGNAAKFTESGSVTVEAGILSTPMKDGRMRVFFSVTDTGIGIPEEKIDRIFDPFTQVDGSSTRKYQGTGLGLGIVQRLVGLMDGSITVSSESGKGTTIGFTIAASQPSLAAEMAVRAPETDTVVPLNILVAEDERVNQAVIKRLLGKIGHTVVCVDNGAKALDMLGKAKFDCVLMDIQMPELDGMEATRAIRESLGLDVPVIALTAHAMKGDRKRFLEAGMDGYIAKPFDMIELVSELHRVVGSPREV
ncbi:PAS domain S-box protein [uncultured Pseudodesulfovibrio sp.]|uniref:PAS domain-containing hybrid sensor histidine kinase/response regulator n=1 Tax=uncultured Pseudodesulfovibrio sp. TaxID=2035858 RepID=UPI0029C61663|nr:PAS domain S-box protein [uncultured Pseudodesulfovibrio sp.]